MAKSFRKLRESLTVLDTPTARLAAGVLSVAISDAERGASVLSGKRVSGATGTPSSAAAVLDAVDFLSNAERWRPWAEMAGLSPVDFVRHVEEDHNRCLTESQEANLKAIAGQ